MQREGGRCGRPDKIELKTAARSRRRKSRPANHHAASRGFYGRWVHIEGVTRAPTYYVANCHVRITKHRLGNRRMKCRWASRTLQHTQPYSQRSFFGEQTTSCQIYHIRSFPLSEAQQSRCYDDHGDSAGVTHMLYLAWHERLSTLSVRRHESPAPFVGVPSCTVGHSL